MDIVKDTRKLERMASLILRSPSKAKLKKRSECLNSKNFKSEVWFRQILIENGFCHNKSHWGYSMNHPVYPFFIDFAFVSMKIGLEVDGAEHRKKKGLAVDEKRDEFLRVNGWFVYRIPYPCKPKTVSLIMDVLTTAKSFLHAQNDHQKARLFIQNGLSVIHKL